MVYAGDLYEKNNFVSPEKVSHEGCLKIRSVIHFSRNPALWSIFKNGITVHKVNYSVFVCVCLCVCVCVCVCVCYFFESEPILRNR